MPQLTLEYTSNVIEKDDFSTFFRECHHILTETLPTQLYNCKSRAVLQKDYYIGDGTPKNAFVSLHIKFIEGRSPAVIKAVAEAIMKTLKTHFTTSLRERNLQITLQLQELSKDLYFIESSLGK